MKTLKNLILASAVCVAAILPASAQFNPYGEGRLIVMGYPITLRTDGLSKGITNNPINIRDTDGVGFITLACQTNSGVGTLTCTIQQSPDLTNWTTLANCAISTSNAITSTNFGYGYTNAPAATNQVLLPGTVVSPNASTAGFATGYVLPAQFNSNAVVTMSTNLAATVGFIVNDAQQFIRTTWSATGAHTNYDGISAYYFAHHKR